MTQDAAATQRSTELLDVPVSGGSLRVARTGNGGKKLVLGLHGLAGSRVTIEPIAPFLSEEFTFVSVDLRGRGASASLPGPYGIEQHAKDCIDVLEYLGAGSVVVVGHSMGALVAGRIAARRPDLIRGVVLMDGGLPSEIALPPGTNIEDVMNAFIGPVLANVRKHFPTEDAFLDQWRRHPGWGGVWNSAIEARFRYEMEGQPPNVHSRTSADALKADMEDAFRNTMSEATEALRAVRCPIHSFRAPRGLLNQPEPAISNAVVARWQSELPQLVDTMVAETNHVTLGALDHSLKLVAASIMQLGA